MMSVEESALALRSLLFRLGAQKWSWQGSQILAPGQVIVGHKPDDPPKTFIIICPDDELVALKEAFEGQRHKAN